MDVINVTRGDVTAITLLTAEEYLEDKDTIPRTNIWWWLRTPGSYNNKEAYVFIDGEVYRDGYYIEKAAGVRPVFKVRPEIAEQLYHGGKVKIGSFTATVLKSGLCLLDECVCKHPFDGKDNNWAQAELRSYIRSGEFLGMIFVE